MPPRRPTRPSLSSGASTTLSSTPRGRSRPLMWPSAWWFGPSSAPRPRRPLPELLEDEEPLDEELPALPPSSPPRPRPRPRPLSPDEPFEDEDDELPPSSPPRPRPRPLLSPEELLELLDEEPPRFLPLPESPSLARTALDARPSAMAAIRVARVDLLKVRMVFS